MRRTAQARPSMSPAAPTQAAPAGRTTRRNRSTTWPASSSPSTTRKGADKGLTATKSAPPPVKVRRALCRARCYLLSRMVLVGEDRRDRRRGVDEPDLDVAIPLSAPPDKRKAARIL